MRNDPVYKHMEGGPWMVIPAVQPAIGEQPSLVSLALQHDHGIRIDVLLPPNVAEKLARNIIEAARAVRTGETPNFASRRTT